MSGSGTALDDPCPSSSRQCEVVAARECPPTEPGHRTWRLSPHFIVRSTGFAFDALDALRLERPTQMAERLVDLEAELRAAAKNLLDGALHAVMGKALDAHAPPRELKLLRAIRALVHRRQQVPAQRMSALNGELLQSIAGDLERWNRTVEEVVLQRAEVASVFAQEFATSRRALRAIASDCHFQEAVFLSNPGFYKTGLRAYLEHERIRGSRTRQYEATLITYLQRFCAKNDTASFFGPLNYAHVSADRSNAVRIDYAPTRLRRRETFFAYWAVRQLARQVSDEPEIRSALPVRQSPFCRLRDDGRLELALVERTVRLNEAQRRVFAAADGRRTASEIAEFTGLPPEEVETTVLALAGASVVARRIEPTSSDFHPLATLIQQLDPLPECGAKRRWIDALGGLESSRRDFAVAELTQREEILARVEREFERLSGEPPRRGAGEMYADRTVLYEECLGSIERMEFGGALFDRIRASLELPLRVAACHARLRQAALEARASEVFAELSRESTEVSYGRFAHRLNEAVEDDAPEGVGELGRFVERLHDAVARAERNGHAKLTRDDLSFLPEYEAGAGGLVSSPDLMIAAPSLEALNRGDFTLILAELHDDVTLWDTLMYFHPAREEVGRCLRDALEDRRAFPELAWIQFSRNNKCFALELPGTTIELTASSPRNRALVVPVSDLIVVNERGRLRLRSRSTGRVLTLYCGLTNTLAEHVLSLPKVKAIEWARGPSSPRVEVEGVVVQRRRWRFESVAVACEGSIDDELAVFLAVNEFRLRHVLPPRVFMSTPLEPKPLFIDFANPFLARVFIQIARKGRFVLEEMLPGPDDLWLVEGGARHCVELRTTAFHR